MCETHIQREWPQPKPPVHFLEQAGTYNLSGVADFSCIADQDTTLSYTIQPLIASDGLTIGCSGK